MKKVILSVMFGVLVVMSFSANAVTLEEFKGQKEQPFEWLSQSPDQSNSVYLNAFSKSEDFYLSLDCYVANDKKETALFFINKVEKDNKLTDQNSERETYNTELTFENKELSKTIKMFQVSNRQKDIFSSDVDIEKGSDLLQILSSVQFKVSVDNKREKTNRLYSFDIGRASSSFRDVVKGCLPKEK